MKRAWERCRERMESRSAADIETIVDMVSRASVSREVKEYKKRFIVKTGEKIIIIPVEDIAYCFSEDKSTYAVNKNGTRRLLDYSLDMVQEMLDPKLFFRISRSYIVSINAIENISKHLGTRLKIQLNPPSPDEVVVSRSRTSDFLEWLDNN
jgi:DNA-binding LytR/AlgR family response regulator